MQHAMKKEVPSMGCFGNVLGENEDNTSLLFFFLLLIVLFCNSDCFGEDMDSLLFFFLLLVVLFCNFCGADD